MNNKINFNNWMAKIKNIHYSNDARMSLAFEKIEEYEEIQCQKLHKI